MSRPFDAIAYAAACAVLLGAGFTAIFVAARGASLAQPAAVLNAD